MGYFYIKGDFGVGENSPDSVLVGVPVIKSLADAISDTITEKDLKRLLKIPALKTRKNFTKDDIPQLIEGVLLEYVDPDLAGAYREYCRFLPGPDFSEEAYEQAAQILGLTRG